MTARLAVVGNGAAGALVVTCLLDAAARRGRALDLAWVGDGEPGRGVAYATPHDWHRLNVPSSKMTLDAAGRTFPDWLAEHGGDDDPFAPRHAFGSYLVETLRAARAAAGPDVRLTEHRERAVHASADDGGVRITLRCGTTVPADRAVLALGPFPSPPLPGLDPRLADDPRVVDAWDGRLEQVTDGETVLLVGTGLTMVDAALTVGRTAPRARMVAVSRSGLLPREHVPHEGEPGDPAVLPRPGLGLDELVAGIERAVDECDGRWREVVDGLRPVTPALWGALPRPEQRRFLAEQARRWETHRHRMAPSVAGELAELRADGRLRLHGGGVRDVATDGDPLAATVGDPGERYTVDRIVSCIGAREDVGCVDDPLVRALLDGGLARGHPLGLGFDTGPHGRLDAAGLLLAVGNLRRGELYETTAVPEIREQALDLAGHLLG